MRVAGEEEAPAPRNREDPLPDRSDGNDPVDEVRGGVRHAATAAGRAEPTALARERHETLALAFVAADAQETVGQDAAVEERAELRLDETRHNSLAVSRSR